MMAKTPIGKWYKSLPKWSARLLLAMIAMATLIIVVDLALMTTFALQASGISLQRTPTSVAPTSVAPTSVVPTSTAPTTTPTTALWTPTAEPTASPTEVVSPTATMIPTATVEPTASATPTSEPTATTSPTTEPTATATDVVQPTATATAEPTPTQVVWPTATSTPVIVEWRGEYFDNGTLIGLPTVVRNDQAVNFDWGFNGPAAGLPADGFSARWTRVLGFTEGLYRFHARMDDGLRLYVDGQLILDEWRAGGARELTVDRRLSAGNHSVRVEYYEQSGTATVLVWWEKVNAPSYPDWKGEYWSNRTLNGDPALVRNDGANVSGGGFQFDWGQGSPSSAIPSDHFSARWTRQVDLDKGTYRFHALVDDGVRLWVDGQLIVDAWSDHDGREFTSDYALVKGTHQFRVEYYERVGNARIRVWWEKISAPSYPDWKGEYWNNRELRGDPALVRNDSAIDFDWREGSASPGLPIDDFSARWTRQLWFEQGTYRFHALVDDGVRLWLDGQLLIDAWYDHGTHELTVDIAVARGTHDVKVEYYDRLRQAQIGVWWDRVASPSYPDWKAEYWDNRDLTGNPVLVRNDRELDFNWGKGAAAAGLPVDNWSARWSRKVTFQPGVYRFYAWADDGIRIAIDGRRVIDEWHGATNEVYEIDGALSGERQLTVEFSEHSGDARVRFWWKRLGDIPTPTPTATTQPTATATATATTQPTPTATATTEPTPTATATTEPTPTATATSEPTPTATATTEPTPTATATPEPTPTPTVTTQPTPTATATTEPTPEQASVRINELLTVPGKTDWDGDGSVGENDEWIELHNGSTALVDLSGWTLEASDKVPPGLAKGKAKGEAKAQDLSDTYQFPAETVLEPGKFLVLFRGQTGLALRDKGGDLRLLDAQGDLVDSVTFEKLPPDVSYSRSEEGPWLVSHQPSPGATNVLPSVRPAR